MKIIHMLKNSQKIVVLMFVYGTYVLEGETDTRFSLGGIWNLFQEDTLPNNAINFCRKMKTV